MIISCDSLRRQRGGGCTPCSKVTDSLGICAHRGARLTTVGFHSMHGSVPPLALTLSGIAMGAVKHSLGCKAGKE